MEHIAALLLIVGCSDDLQQCQELPAPAPVFQTVQECNEMMESTMLDFTGEYPQILARCVSTDPSKEYTDARLEWDISPAGNLTASIETSSDYMIASTGSEKVGVAAR